MTHDPMCPLTPPTADYEPYLAEAVRAIQQETPCQCDLIAKVRADMLAKCIEAVELCTTYKGGVDRENEMGVEWAIVALEALREQP